MPGSSSKMSLIGCTLADFCKGAQLGSERHNKDLDSVDEGEDIVVKVWAVNSDLISDKNEGWGWALDLGEINPKEV
ncbi:unnamed protein product, partial [Adineta ricciae]